MFLKIYFIFFFFFIMSNFVIAIDIKKRIFLSSYLKGINLADAVGQFNIKSNQFYFELDAKTAGIFSVILDWKQTLYAEAVLINKVLKSKEYRSNDARGKKKGHMYLSFLDNIPKIISAQPDPREDNRRANIDKMLLVNTNDPVIGILNIGLNGNCNNKEIIFDGKRKYAIKSNFLKKDKIEKGSFYSEDFDAIKCVFNIEKLQGYTKKEIKRYPTNGYIWYKKIKNNLFFPAKIQISTNWGNFICLIKEKDFEYEICNN